jgi:hypothetical protein
MSYEDDYDEQFSSDPLAVFKGCAVAILMSLLVCVVSCAVLSVLL